MREEAAAGGFYEPERLPQLRCPRIQILTVRELLEGAQLECPRMKVTTVKKASRRYRKPEQKGYDDSL